MPKEQTQILTVAGIVIAVAVLLYFTRGGQSGDVQGATQFSPSLLGASNPGSGYLTYNYPSPATIAAITQSDTAGVELAQANAQALAAGVTPGQASACGCAGASGNGQANTPFFSTVGALAKSFTGSLSNIENSLQDNLLSALPNWVTQSPGIANESYNASLAFGGT